MTGTLDLAAGYEALATDAGTFALARDVLRVTGPEATAYLQGQLSQDIAALPVGASAWSLLLQPQGKLDAWLRVTRIADDAFVLDVDAGWGAAALERLRRFKLRTKAEFEQLDWRCVAVRGPSAPQSLDTDGVTASATWPLVGGIDLLGPDPAPPHGVVHVPPDAYEVRRIEAGLPRMGAELTDRTIPAEAGIVDASVSFTKGCYTGQELVARIDSRGGHIPRRLLGVVLDGVVPPATSIEVDGAEVGILTSVAAHPHGGAVAIGIVRRGVEPGTVCRCGGVAGTIRTLPLVS